MFTLVVYIVSALIIDINSLIDQGSKMSLGPIIIIGDIFIIIRFIGGKIGVTQR